MKVRLLFRDYEISDSNKQQLLYGVAVLVSIASAFSIIFMFSYYSEDPSQAAFPSPSGDSAFTNNLSQANKPQVAGAQTEMPPQQPIPSSGPDKPSPKPSPSPSPSATPSTTPTPTPTATPTPTPTPTPSTSSSSVSAPSAPSGLNAVSGCDGSTVKIVLTWSSTSGADKYKIFRDGNEIKDNVDATTYSDTSVSVGTLYAYSIKAKNSGGESNHSDSKTITPTSCNSSPTPSSSP